MISSNHLGKKTQVKLLLRLLDFWGQFSFDFKKRQNATIATQQITYSAIAWFPTKPRHCEKFRNLKQNAILSDDIDHTKRWFLQIK